MLNATCTCRLTQSGIQLILIHLYVSKQVVRCTPDCKLQHKVFDTNPY